MFSSAPKFDLRFETEKSADQWRLFARSSNDEPEFVWESRDQEELLEISNKYLVWCSLKKEFDESRILKNHPLMDGNKPANLKGVELSIDKVWRGGLRVEAKFNNEMIGFLDTSFNNFKSFLLLGKSTTSSGEWISEKWRGRGLCAAMYEFLERNTGITSIPHGETAFYGFQSQQSMAFWGKRAKLCHVPGYDDPNIKERIDRINFVYSVYQAESIYKTYSSDLNIALAKTLEVPLTALIDDRGVQAAFCKLNNTQAFCGAGPVSIEQRINDIAQKSRDGYKYIDMSADDLIRQMIENCREKSREQDDYYREKVARGDCTWQQVEESGILEDHVAEYKKDMDNNMKIADMIITKWLGKDFYQNSINSNPRGELTL